MTDTDLSPDPTSTSCSDGEWERRDVWLGVLFLLPAVLHGIVLWSLFEKGVHGLLIVVGGLFCLFLAALGLNAIVRSLTASK